MESNKRPILAAALVGGLLLALAYPTLRWLIREWLTNDYYSHGWLVPPVAAYFAWRQWPKGERDPANAGLIPLGVGLVGYLVALVGKAYFLAALALIVLLVGLVWFFLGTRGLRKLAFPLGFLLFMVPLPFVERASLPLQLLTGSCSTVLARGVGVEATVHGAQVILPNVELVVGAQCSGLRSIVALFTLVAIFVYVLQGPWWGRLLLALSAIPVAILGNIFRVASLLWVADTWGAGAGMRYYHDYSGLAFFLFAFALLLLLSRAFQCREIRADIW